jgi:hypothetical protein
VLSAIYVNRDLLLEANEVNDIGPDGCLSAELAPKALSPNRKPEATLSVAHSVAHCAGKGR